LEITKGKPERAAREKSGKKEEERYEKNSKKGKRKEEEGEKQEKEEIGKEGKVSSKTSSHLSIQSVHLDPHTELGPVELFIVGDVLVQYTEHRHVLHCLT
jgi:hypothetical protein